MKITITGRQIDVTPALKRSASSRLKKLTKFLDGDIEAHVILTVQKKRHHAEVIIRDRLVTLSAVAETSDMYTSLNQVADRLERQAKKQREKIQSVKKRKGAKASPRQIRKVDRVGSETPTVVRVPLSTLKPMSLDEAMLRVGGGEQEFLVFRNATSHRISVLYRRKDGNFGLIEPEA